ncbi:4011_t:CDS:10 [Funneliformis geosporum]|nr:4011_t:CDS:10 [Funneliformis geosporum]
MLGFYAIAEVVDDSNKRPTKTIFCYLETGFQKHQLKSLQAIARMVKENGAQVFTSLEEVAEWLNGQQEVQVEIKKVTSLSSKDLPFKLIDIREAEKNLRTEQLEKLKSESVKEVENGKNEVSMNPSKILNNSGRKSLIKAINASISYQISKLGSYYNNATVTLISMQAEVLKGHEKNEEEICLLEVLETIVNSSGQALAEIWVLRQPSWAKVKFSSHEESLEGSVKIATPLEEEFQEIFLNIVKVAVEEGYGKDFQDLDFLGISEKIGEKIKELCRLKDEPSSLSFFQEAVPQKNTYPLENEIEKLEKEANEINSTPLHIAVANNEKNLVVKLLENDENNTLIHTAAGVNNLDLLKLLVRYGANVNHANDDGIVSNARTKQGVTARDIFLQKDQSYAEIYDNFLEGKIKIINYFQEQMESINDCDYSSINTEREKSEKSLDTLTRLLTGNETCVAVCYYREKLFIASNREKVEYAKEYLGKLRNFVNDNSSENYEKLVEMTIEQTFFECLKSSNKLEELQKIAEELHKEVIRGLEETIVAAIRNDHTKYIEVKGKQKSKLHAEMKIVEEICKIKEKVEAYIGLTKTTCVDCYSVIELLNNGGHNLNVCGTHSQSYQW